MVVVIVCFNITFMYLYTDSSAITSLNSDSPDGSTLILNWEPPDSPNGDIHNYTVRVTRHSDGVRISEQNVMDTTFTATSLSESDLYFAVKVIPMTFYLL